MGILEERLMVYNLNNMIDDAEKFGACINMQDIYQTIILVDIIRLIKTELNKVLRQFFTIMLLVFCTHLIPLIWNLTMGHF